MENKKEDMEAMRAYKFNKFRIYHNTNRQKAMDDAISMSQRLYNRTESAGMKVIKVESAINSYEARIVLVNDNTLGAPVIQKVLESAERNRIKIEVFNSSDEVGTQLGSFKGIASIS